MVPVFWFQLCPLFWLYTFLWLCCGRYLHCEFVFCGKSFRVCCIYAPNHNPARDQFFDDLQAKVDPSVPTILCGDFNAVFDRSVDHFGSDPSDVSHESFSSLQDLFDACCTVDIWRYLHPSSSTFFWTRWDGSRASRIDLCGIPYVWVSSVLSCDLLPCLSLTIVVSSLLSRSRMLSHLAPVCGSSIFLSCRSRRMSV